MSGPVFVVYEGPDMTYYGDATIHGVYADEETARARAAAIWNKMHPNWTWDDLANVYVGEFEIESADNTETS